MAPAVQNMVHYTAKTIQNTTECGLHDQNDGRALSKSAGLAGSVLAGSGREAAAVTSLAQGCTCDVDAEVTWKIAGARTCIEAHMGLS